MSSSPRHYPVVAIDGPAGAGKSTVSSRVAQALGYQKLDTGAIYRCVALRALQQGVVEEPGAVAKIALDLAARTAIQFVQAPRGQSGQPASKASGGEEGTAAGIRVVLDGVDVTADIRLPEVGTAASRTSSVPEVREALLAIQRDFGTQGRVVVEGRDIGSVVFPDAEAKFFLTASTRARAERRYSELTTAGGTRSVSPLTLEAVESEVRERDHRDSSRPVAPLTQAPDAVVVDSTNRGIDEVVEQIVAHVRTIEAKLSLNAKAGKRRESADG